ncbi:MAG TPA: DsbA family oxidoreductase [Usitatibacteraceae bacterium]
MNAPIKIDFVSDVSCPWCVIGLKSLQDAIRRLGDTAATDIHFQPFELNPDMVAEGEDTTEHLAKKYRLTPEQAASNRENIRARGAAVGFEFRLDKRNRIYNTFDAHRLLHWAEQEGLQLALKEALFRAYFTDGESPGSHAVLVRLADEVGLDPVRAKEILESDTHATEVRERERFYLDNGIHAVPAVIINERYLISGGQPPEVFEQALRQAAAGG